MKGPRGNFLKTGHNLPLGLQDGRIRMRWSGVNVRLTSQSTSSDTFSLYSDSENFTQSLRAENVKWWHFIQEVKGQPHRHIKRFHNTHLSAGEPGIFSLSLLIVALLERSLCPGQRCSVGWDVSPDMHNTVLLHISHTCSITSLVGYRHQLCRQSSPTIDTGSLCC